MDLVTEQSHFSIKPNETFTTIFFGFTGSEIDRFFSDQPVCFINPRFFVQPDGIGSWSLDHELRKHPETKYQKIWDKKIGNKH